MKVYDHIEKYLGTITKGWSLKDGNNGIQVLEFKDELETGVYTYTTLGLSNKILTLGDKNVRQELIFAAYNLFDKGEIASFLLTFASHIKDTGKGLLRGECVEGKPLIAGVKATGIYSSNPVFWQDGFYAYEESSPPTIFVWLMPIMKDEATYIKEAGWSAFEDLLETAQCDFWNLNRDSIIM